MSYKGMRWFKCDLQMQTPADAGHWRGAPGADATAAEMFIQRCLDEGIGCIAITDHNFASKDFIDLLRTANEKLSKKSSVPPIHIFPGFEIEADVGKGLHALAIFDADLPLDTIDHRLTQCGVAPPRFDGKGAAKSSTKNLRDILREVQTKRADGRLEGLVICAHPMGEHGIFDKDSIADWLQREEWTNNDLLTVEIPKPVDQMNKRWQALFANGSDCFTDWKRIRPIGRFMSSDCKAYTEAEDEGNYIGKRFCWVKMSEPSIESLRQASLDYESRTWFEEKQPEALHTHVTSIRVTGAKFLKDQEISFSPHLNCIIGGRGSGKSTVLEYLRIALRAFPHDFREGAETAAAKQLRRIRSTLSSTSSIEVGLIHRGVKERINFTGNAGMGAISGREVIDESTVFQQFGVLAFSQDEITELASERSFLSIVDETAHAKLAEIKRTESEQKSELRGLYEVRRSRVNLERELKTVEQSLAEVQRQLEASSELQGELKSLQLAEESVVTARGYADLASEVESELDNLSQWLKSQFAGLPDVGEKSASSDVLNALRTRLVAGVQAAQSALEQQRGAFLKSTDLGEDSADLALLDKRSADAREALEAACAKRGVSSAALHQLNELADEQARLMRLVTDVNGKLQDLRQKEARIPEAQTRLFHIWSSRAVARRAELEQILKSPTMPRTASGKPILEPTITSSGDRKSFLDYWSRHAPDGRSVLGREWNGDSGIGNAIFDAFCASGEPGSPVWWLDARLNDESLTSPEAVQKNRKHLEEYRSREWERWEEMLLHWNEDGGDIKLLRNDDTVAGSLANKDLSDGQRNTAILSLLLARGEGPILIDQPESELDSSFLYTELVPMLRQAKKGRQLIVVTHNANIPVNGDAELVYALESVGGRGVPKAEGGLDREVVTQAVVDIMEGTEEAFRRRQEKYHF